MTGVVAKRPNCPVDSWEGFDNQTKVETRNWKPETPTSITNYCRSISALGAEFEDELNRPGNSRSTNPTTADMIDPAVLRKSEPA